MVVLIIIRTLFFNAKIDTLFSFSLLIHKTFDRLKDLTEGVTHEKMVLILDR